MKQEKLNESERKNLKAVLSLLPKLEKGVTRIQYSGDRPLFQIFAAYEAIEGGCV